MTQRIHISKVSTDSLIDYDLLYSVSPNPSLNYDVNMQIIDNHSLEALSV